MEQTKQVEQPGFMRCHSAGDAGFLLGGQEEYEICQAHSNLRPSKL